MKSNTPRDKRTARKGKVAPYSARPTVESVFVDSLCASNIDDKDSVAASDNEKGKEGYDSDGEPIPGFRAQRNVKPPKKNRVGQQARRKLWEQMYGSEAQHLKKETQMNRRDRRSRPDNQMTYANTTENPLDKPRSRPLDKLRNKSKQEPKEILHPSWEAKRKQKQTMKGIRINPNAVSSNRIVFDVNNDE